ncbi:DUF6349 family protein [Nonomuraea fastidiosa]|uniref:DUF6349 family protein n=1 Tax=Nonomuraea fastidiosa TaxID=46173 RepID=UPI00367054D2
MSEVRGAVARHRLWQQQGRPAGGWCIMLNQPGHRNGAHAPVEATETCQVTVLFGSSGGRSVKRGACLGCDWEGPDRASLNQAIEDGHDHAFPGWRTLPAVVRKPSADWLEQVTRAYPPGWFSSGGPIITVRGMDRLHWPCQAPGGGYDLAFPYDWKIGRWRRQQGTFQPPLLDATI